MKALECVWVYPPVLHADKKKDVVLMIIRHDTLNILSCRPFELALPGNDALTSHGDLAKGEPWSSMERSTMAGEA